MLTVVASRAGTAESPTSTKARSKLRSPRKAGAVLSATNAANASPARISTVVSANPSTVSASGGLYVTPSAVSPNSARPSAGHAAASTASGPRQPTSTARADGGGAAAIAAHPARGVRMSVTSVEKANEDGARLIAP
jgi:hypothetical protein